MIKRLQDTSVVLNDRNKHKITPMLLRYLAEGNDLSYGLNMQHIKPCFITNRNPLEENIPLFNIPILVEDVMDQPIMFIDLRNYLKGAFDEQKTLKGNISDPTIIEAIELMLNYTSYYSKYSDGFTLPTQAATILGGVLSHNLAQSYILNYDEEQLLTLICIYKVLSNFVNVSKESVIDVLANIKLISYSHGEIEDILKRLDGSNTIEGFVSDIIKTDISDKLVKMDKSIIMITMSYLVFGKYPTSNITLAFEHLPTALGLIHLIDTGRLYKKTKLKHYMDTMSRILDMKDVKDRIEADLKFTESNYTMEKIAPEVTVNIDNVEDVPADIANVPELLCSINGLDLYYIASKDNVRHARLYVYGVDFDDSELTSLIVILENLDKDIKLQIVINSNGGYINDGMRVINVILNKFKDVDTVINNTAKSMGTVFFGLGSKRTVYEFSTIMFHTSSGGGYGKSQEVSSSVKLSNDNAKLMNQMLVVDTGMLSEEEFEKMNDGKDYWFDTEQMVRRGIATHVMYKGKELTAEQYIKHLDKK